MIKLNRIGYKLGLAGAVGVLLAIGMVANQMITEARIEQASERATRSQQVANNALAAHIDLRKIQLAAGDVRLSRKPAEVAKASHFKVDQAAPIAKVDMTRSSSAPAPASAASRRRWRVSSISVVASG